MWSHVYGKQQLNPTQTSQSIGTIYIQLFRTSLSQVLNTAILTLFPISDPWTLMPTAHSGAVTRIILEAKPLKTTSIA